MDANHDAVNAGPRKIRVKIWLARLCRSVPTKQAQQVFKAKRGTNARVPLSVPHENRPRSRSDDPTNPHSRIGDQAGSDAKFGGSDGLFRCAPSGRSCASWDRGARWLAEEHDDTSIGRPGGTLLQIARLERMRSPEPSVRITPIWNCPPVCLVKATRSPRGDPDRRRIRCRRRRKCAAGLEPSAFI